MKPPIHPKRRALIVGSIALIALVVISGIVQRSDTTPPLALSVSLLSITTNATTGRVRGVFQVDNGLIVPVTIPLALVEQNSGWHWDFLCPVNMERADDHPASIHYPPGRTIFQTWLPDRGGPYRLVLPTEPRVPLESGWRQRLAHFLADHKLVPDRAYKMRLHLEGNPPLLTAPFRVSAGTALRTVDFPPVTMPALDCN